VRAPADSRIAVPGKLMVAGEYAVRHGAAGLALAVDREARLRWCSGPVPAADLVARARADCARALGRRPQGHCRVDSTAFRRGGRKLGLGSSAAVAAAATASVFFEAGRALESPAERQRMWRLARASHDAHQGLAGSGLDVAAALFGGWVRLDPGGPDRAVAAWAPPPGLRLVFCWLGRPASTPELVAAVDAFAAREPAAHRALMDEMAALSAALLRSPSAADAVELLDGYGSAMAALGRRSATPIVPPIMQPLLAAARDRGGAAKPAGAGGGDFALAAFAAADAAGEFERAARALGAAVLDWRIHDRGVHAVAAAALSRQAAKETRA
jgi:phosphomevalonate kinase